MLKTAKVVGLNTDTDAALSLICKSAEDYNLFIVVSCKSDDAFSKIKQAFAEIEASFYSQAGTVSDRLLTTFQNVKASLKNVDSIELLIGCAKSESSPDNQKILYLIYSGDQILAKLYRQGKATDLKIDAASDQVISGPIKGRDRIVLATSSLYEFLGEEQARISEWQIDQVEDEVTARLPQARSVPLAGIVLEEAEEKVTPQAGQSPDGPGVRQSSGSGVHLPEMNFWPKNFQFPVRALIGVSLLAVLAVGGIAFIQHRNQFAAQELENKFLTVQSHYSKALEIRDTDQAEALQQLDQAQTGVEELLKIKSDETRFKKLSQDIQSAVPQIRKIYEVGDLSAWLELDLIKSGMKANSMSMSLGQVLLLDSDHATLALVNLANKSQKILAGGEKLKGAKLAALNGDSALSYGGGIGLIRVDIPSGSLTNIVKPDKDLGEIKQIYGFGGNIYLLDKSSNQIWKYLPIVTGFSEKRNYFKDGVSPDLSQAIKMHIDSSIWILKTSSELVKYTQGSPDYFSITGLPQPKRQITNFFVSDQTDNLYLLDSLNQSLVVLDKKGVYKAQYKINNLVSYLDFVVDEENKQAFFLDGANIYRMELK